MCTLFFIWIFALVLRSQRRKRRERGGICENGAGGMGGGRVVAVCWLSSCGVVVCSKGRVCTFACACAHALLGVLRGACVCLCVCVLVCGVCVRVCVLASVGVLCGACVRVWVCLCACVCVCFDGCAYWGVFVCSWGIVGRVTSHGFPSLCRHL
jgi:hypothetical protein